MAELAHPVEGFGRIDVWVNNAGVYLLGSLEATLPDAFRRVLETNFFGYVHGARAVLPRFREQGHGVLINNASVYSHVGAPWLSAYLSSKFAVRGFSEALRQELDDLPEVHVCTVSPSPIDTPIFASAANYTGRAVKAPRPHLPARAGRQGDRGQRAAPQAGTDRRWRGPAAHPAGGDGPAPVRAGQPALRRRAAVHRRASPRHRRQPVRAPAPTAAPRRVAAGGVGQTRQSRSAGWSRPGCWPPARWPSLGSSHAPAAADHEAKQQAELGEECWLLLDQLPTQVTTRRRRRPDGGLGQVERGRPLRVLGAQLVEEVYARTRLG